MNAEAARKLGQDASVIVDGYDNMGDFFAFSQPAPATFVGYDDTGVRVLIPQRGWTTYHVPFEHASIQATTANHPPPCAGYVPPPGTKTAPSVYRPDPPSDLG